MVLFAAFMCLCVGGWLGGGEVMVCLVVSHLLHTHLLHTYIVPVATESAWGLIKGIIITSVEQSSPIQLYSIEPVTLVHNTCFICKLICLHVRIFLSTQDKRGITENTF